MADPPKISTALPAPPQMYLDFTPANTRAIAALRRVNRHLATPTTTAAYAASRTDDIAALVPHVPGAPPALNNLQPPPEPADGRWRVFDEAYSLDDAIPSLDEQNVAQLPPVRSEAEAGPDGKHHGHAFELKKLAKSQLLNFLELTGILSMGPEGAEEKLNDIHTIFINMHHILNEYRPHQARESAIQMLQAHLDRTRAETATIRQKTEMARQALEGLSSIEIPPEFRSVFAAVVEETANNEKARAGVDEDRWRVLDDL